MVRSELLEKLLQAHPHLPRHVVEPALDTILNEITDRLAQGHRVELRKFGNFTCKIRGARIGRNPRTGDAIHVESKQVLRFRAGSHILERLNRPTNFG